MIIPTEFRRDGGEEPFLSHTARSSGHHLLYQRRRRERDQPRHLGGVSPIMRLNVFPSLVLCASSRVHVGQDSSTDMRGVSVASHMWTVMRCFRNAPKTTSLFVFRVNVTSRLFAGLQNVPDAKSSITPQLLHSASLPPPKLWASSYVDGP